jgi:hypothetical protein
MPLGLDAVGQNSLALPLDRCATWLADIRVLFEPGATADHGMCRVTRIEDEVRFYDDVQTDWPEFSAGCSGSSPAAQFGTPPKNLPNYTTSRDLTQHGGRFSHGDDR